MSRSKFSWVLPKVWFFKACIWCSGSLPKETLACGQSEFHPHSVADLSFCEGCSFQIFLQLLFCSLPQIRVRRSRVDSDWWFWTDVSLGRTSCSLMIITCIATLTLEVALSWISRKCTTLEAALKIEELEDRFSPRMSESELFGKHHACHTESSL